MLIQMNESSFWRFFVVENTSRPKQVYILYKDRVNNRLTTARKVTIVVNTMLATAKAMRFFVQNKAEARSLD